MPVAWRSPGNGDPDWGSRQLMVRWTDDGTPNQAWSGKAGLVMLLNMERDDVSFTLPSGSWTRAVDTQQYFDDDDYLVTEGHSLRETANFDDAGTVVSGSYSVPSTTIVLLEEAR